MQHRVDAAHAAVGVEQHDAPVDDPVGADVGGRHLLDGHDVAPGLAVGVPASGGQVPQTGEERAAAPVGERMTKLSGSDSKSTLYCSFCGKSQHEVRKLIAGPTVFICDECVDICLDIIAEEAPAQRHQRTPGIGIVYPRPRSLRITARSGRCRRA